MRNKEEKCRKVDFYNSLINMNTLQGERLSEACLPYSNGEKGRKKKLCREKKT